MKKNNKKAHVLWDLCLILVFIIAALVSLIVIKKNSSSGSYAVVQKEGLEIERYNLEYDGSFSVNGGTNILQIEDGKARLIDATCPDKLCVNQGWIRYTRQCITCLPNKITVTIIGADDTVDLVL